MIRQPFLIPLTIFFIFLHFISSGKGSNKTLRLEDWIYENNIRTVQLYPNGGNNTDIFQSPIVSIAQAFPLMLEFDEMGSEYNYYYAKIIRCESNWTQSDMMDIRFMSEINEILLTQYQLSNATKVAYTHYTFQLPKVKISGNYVLMIYRDGNKDDIIITRRFCVYENRVPIGLKVSFSDVTRQRSTHQQLNVTANYYAYNAEVTNTADFKIVMRQNARWDNAIVGLPPLYVKDFDKVLDYSYFNGETTFPGGNEFRAFDTRSIMFQQLNIDRLEKDNKSNVAVLMPDKKKNSVYEYLIDINGRFVINRYESNNSATDPDYVTVKFQYKVPEELDGDVYVLGGLTDWKLRTDFKMTYDAENQTYTCAPSLKQGYYNYVYVYKPKNGKVQLSPYEGCFSVTENIYDVLLYYRPITSQTDLLIGYQNTQYVVPR